MALDKYRIKSPTIALFLERGHHVAHLVPAGSVISVDSKTFDVHPGHSSAGREGQLNFPAMSLISRRKSSIRRGPPASSRWISRLMEFSPPVRCRTLSSFLQ
jgi:hypothetical protein